jgi:serine/threonine protein kinase/tetratricopeptide (TPR) repeat protein
MSDAPAHPESSRLRDDRRDDRGDDARAAGRGSRTEPPEAEETPLPKRLAQFDIVRRLGAGGMAEVFLARKPGAEGTFKQLVLKRILPTHGASRRFRTMFVEEALLATRLNHPNVVQVYEFYDEGGDVGHLLAMEHVDGPDLGRLMAAAKARGTRVPPWVAAWVVAEAAKGLHYAHERKDEGGAPLDIVHRDVSPQNILLSYEGAVKIADFGIASARLFEEEAGVLKGKFGYMSPEQARGERVDRRSDLYALGVILWELLAGRPLHGGLGGEALLDIVRSGYVESPSSYVAAIPSALEAIVMRALAPRREDRFATGKEFANAIARALLAEKELVDAGALEATLAELLPKDELEERIASAQVVAQGRTQAAVPLALSGAEVSPSHGSRKRADDGEREAGPPSPRRALSEGPREVRHVAVLTLRLHGVDPEKHRDPLLATRALERLRAMLGDIAYKRRVQWQWSSDVEARAIAGLASNPARAASDAAWLALDTHEALAGIQEDFPLDVGASIAIVRGIASGTRDAQGHLVRYQLHEPALYLADVLGKQTPASRSWVAGGIYRLVRREFRWGDAPVLRLDVSPDSPPPELAAIRDLVPATMRTYALERSLSREERLAESASAPSDLVGRDAEKAELHAAFHAAVSGNGGVGMVTCRAVIGEMGIGKTALVATFLGELPPNARLIRVENTPVRMDLPYSGVADLIRDAIGTKEDEPFDLVCELIARAGGGTAQGDGSNPMVARLAELATNRLPPPGHDEDPHYRRKMVVSGVRHMLAAIAMQQPLVIVIEGLQWGDRASLDLLVEIMKAPTPLPILVVLVSRPEERVMPILQEAVRIELRGLSADEQVRLVEARLGVRDGVRSICAELMPRVGGNPFFLLEMIDTLLERGALEIREEPTESGEVGHVLGRAERGDFHELPSTLEQLLGDRLRELPAEERVVVDWLAIAGGPLGVSDLLALCRSGDELPIVRLCARGLCDRKGEHVDFRHPLTRDVAFAAIDGPLRVRMHRALGEHLAKSSLARGVSAAIVARHFARGEAPTRAGEFYLEAGRAARRSYQTQLAVRYYHRALLHLPDGDARRIEAHEALEAVYRVLGRRRERLEQLDSLRRAARHRALPRAVSLAYLRTSRFYEDEGHLARGLEHAQRAAAIAHEARLGILEVEAEAQVSDLLRELGDVQGALAASDRALEASDRNRGEAIPPRARAEVLRSRGVLLRRVGRVREAVDAYVDAIATFRRVGAARQEARAKHSLAYALFVQGRYEDAIALALESVQIILSIGGRIHLANALANIGHAYARLGDLSRAFAYFNRARDAHERYGDHDGHADTLIVNAEVLVDAGELDEAEGYLRDAAALNAVSNSAYDATHLLVVRALHARAAGQTREAIAYALEARRSAEPIALVSFHFYGLALEATARADAGEMHAATLLATTALGAVETLQGCEYGLEIRALCAEALGRAGSPQAPSARERAVDHAIALSNTIRSARYRRLFGERPKVARLLADATRDERAG